MIPYVLWQTIPLGPLTVQVWGLFVAAAFLLATAYAARFAPRWGMHPDIIWQTGFWVLVVSMIGARAFDVLFYNYSYYAANPNEIIKIWHGGLSMFGGIIGALVAIWAVMAYHKLNFWSLAEPIARALPLGIFVGRLGCTFIHDHQGIPCSAFCPLAIKYPGGTKHDLGWYEAVLGLCMLGLFMLIDRLGLKGKVTKRFFTSLFAFIYLPVRFLFDFLRVSHVAGADVRYAGLTPTQWVAPALLAIVIGINVYAWRKRQHPNIHANEVSHMS